MRLVLVTVTLVCAALCRPSLADGENSPCLYPEEQECFDIFQPFFMRCPSNASEDALKQYSWLVNGQALNATTFHGRWTLTDGGSTLHVDGARVEQPNTEYTCLVNGEQRAKYQMLPLVVMYLPFHSDAMKGKSLIMTCEVHSTLLPRTVTWWYSNGRPWVRVEQAMGARALLREAGGVRGAQLQLDDVQESDAGQYQCRMGTHSAHTHVSVYSEQMYRMFHPYN